MSATPVMSAKTLLSEIKRIGGSAVMVRGAIQDALIPCAYYAMKDGNVTPFRELLKAAVEGRVATKGIVAWAELFAPVYIKDETFHLSQKSAKMYAVLDPESFEEYRTEMVKVKWYEIVGEERVKSTWAVDTYLEGVVKTLRKHGVDSDIVSKIESAEMEARIAKSALEAEVAAQ